MIHTPETNRILYANDSSIKKKKRLETLENPCNTLFTRDVQEVCNLKSEVEVKPDQISVSKKNYRPVFHE